MTLLAADWHQDSQRYDWCIRFHEGMMTCLRFDVESLSWTRDSHTCWQPAAWQIMVGCY